MIGMVDVCGSIKELEKTMGWSVLCLPEQEKRKRRGSKTHSAIGQYNFSFV